MAIEGASVWNSWLGRTWMIYSREKRNKGLRRWPFRNNPETRIWKEDDRILLGGKYSEDSPKLEPGLSTEQFRWQEAKKPAGICDLIWQIIKIHQIQEKTIAILWGKRFGCFVYEYRLLWEQIRWCFCKRSSKLQPIFSGAESIGITHIWK